MCNQTQFTSKTKLFKLKFVGNVCSLTRFINVWLQIRVQANIQNIFVNYLIPPCADCLGFCDVW